MTIRELFDKAIKGDYADKEIKIYIWKDGRCVDDNDPLEEEMISSPHDEVNISIDLPIADEIDELYKLM